MDGVEHSFPLPETEAHKLDEVKEVIEHPQAQVPASWAAWLQSNPWLGVAFAGVGGLFLGIWLKPRD